MNMFGYAFASTMPSLPLKDSQSYCSEYVHNPEIRMVTFIGKYQFRKPVLLKKYLDGDYCVHIDCDMADLYAVGETENEAYQDLVDELDYAWKTYVESDTVKLHESAIKYRNWLTDNIVVPSNDLSDKN